MKKIVLSIIVNSFNCEKYITQCLKSIINQLSSKTELIVIDDDSSDITKELIEKELNGLTNCSFYSINHSGISEARNIGLKKAKGDFIMFVDGDDYILNNSINRIIEYLKFNNYDLTFFDVIKYFEEKKYYEIEELSLHNNQRILEKDLIKNKIFARPWRFIYKKDMIEKNKLSFAKNLVYEDEEWIPKVFYYSKDINYLNEYIYVYRKRKGSITESKNINHIMDLTSIVKRTYDWSLNCTNKKKYIFFSLSRCIRNIFGSLELFNAKEKTIIFDWYKNNYKMIMDILSYNKKLKYSIYIFGPVNGVRLYKKVFREKYHITKKKFLKNNDITIKKGGEK